MLFLRMVASLALALVILINNWAQAGPIRTFSDEAEWRAAVEAMRPLPDAEFVMHRLMGEQRVTMIDGVGEWNFDTKESVIDVFVETRLTQITRVETARRFGGSSYGGVIEGRLGCTMMPFPCVGVIDLVVHMQTPVQALGGYLQASFPTMSMRPFMSEMRGLQYSGFFGLIYDFPVRDVVFHNPDTDALESFVWRDIEVLSVVIAPGVFGAFAIGAAIIMASAVRRHSKFGKISGVNK